MNSENFEMLVESISNLNRDELNDVVHAVKDRRNYLDSSDLEGFRIGDKVTWMHGSGINKTKYTGVVNKINNKTLGVKEDGRAWVGWRISAGALTKLEKTDEKK